MLGSKLSGVTAGVAVLVGIAGLFYVLAKAVAPTVAAPPEGRAATVEFTRDGKLKRPVGGSVIRVELLRVKDKGGVVLLLHAGWAAV
jgi:hypothetical protein